MFPRTIARGTRPLPGSCYDAGGGARHCRHSGESMAAPAAGVAYWLDRDNRIVRVSGPWDQFALANDGASATASHVVGRPIRDFVTGDETRMWLDAVLDLARAGGPPVVRSYRCDSPDTKRYMQMRIEAGVAGTLCLRHKMTRAEHTIPIRVRFGSLVVPQAVARCSICNRFRCDEAWVELDDPRAKRLAGTTGEVVVFYTVCDTCREPGRAT